jgi:hypothetical protein
MGWSVGFTSHEYNAPDVTLATVELFSTGMQWLEQHVRSVLDNMGETDNDREEYKMLLSHITDVSQDSGIMDDPDQWYDEDFYGDSITFWVVED